MLKVPVSLQHLKQCSCVPGKSKSFIADPARASWRGHLQPTGEFGSAQAAVRVVQYPPSRSAAESPDHTLAAQGFSAILEAVLFPVSCSVEHALASRKWQPGMRGG